MKSIVIAFLIALSPVAFAAGTKPSDSSVKELLQISGAAKMIDMTKGQLTAMQAGAFQQALQGHALTPGLRKLLEEANGKTATLLANGLKWETIEPTFVECYQGTMTQEEVDGIIAFYKTPAGRAMVEKLPALMQISGQKMQAQLAPVMNELKQVQQDTMLQIQAELAK